MYAIVVSVPPSNTVVGRPMGMGGADYGRMHDEAAGGRRHMERACCENMVLPVRLHTLVVAA